MELREEISEPLAISGKIPSWLSGVLVRNGPVNVEVKGQKNAHWFDGLAMLHAFSFDGGKIHYTNRYLRSEAYRKVFEEGRLDYTGFATDPCRSLFRYLLTFFFSPIQNANINVAKIAEQYVALTEVPLPVRFDPATLKTLGVFDYQDALPKDKCWESAHPHHDSHETLNYLIQFGRTSSYTLYRIENGTAERKIIAEVSVDRPSYMHSFAVTENYVIFAEYPLVVKPMDLITKGKAFIKNFTWEPQKGTRFTVIDKKTGKEVKTLFTKPFFAFHHANAFEKDDHIVLDIVAYEDAGIIDNFYLNPGPMTHWHNRVERFFLPLTNGEATSEILLSQSSEFPRINERYDGRAYTYLYLCSFSMKESQGLYKLNTGTKEVITWSEPGCSPGEPVFVASPQAKEEDEGVVLAVVFDHTHHTSFLLILDAGSFKEVGRARVPHPIPAGLHGQFFL